MTTLSVWPHKDNDNIGTVAIVKPEDESECKHHIVELLVARGATSKGKQAFHDLVASNVEHCGGKTTAVKLILSAVDGFILRNDLLQYRFSGCDIAGVAIDLTTAGQRVQAVSPAHKHTLTHMLEYVVAYVVLGTSHQNRRELVDVGMELLEAEIQVRLPSGWITENALPYKRLAIVEGRAPLDQSDAAKGPLEAAAALGLELVILDNEDHWLRDDSQRRDEFLVCDITVDHDLPDRIVTAIRTSRKAVHGLLTFSDSHLEATAIAAHRLGLNTYPVHGLRKCINKWRMRQALSPDGMFLTINKHTSFSPHSFRQRMASMRLGYPLIVKPVQGHSSEGVTRVQDDAELATTVQNLRLHFPGRDILVERYHQGPEVDANIVLMDGDVIFSEINDDFPSSGDVDGTSCFAEQSTIIPSRLPGSELQTLERELVDTLHALGFAVGVFHIEARVDGSRMDYRPKDGALELLPAGNFVGKVSTFLIEINARTPGHQESIAVRYTYGIDYYALYMLLAFTHGSQKDILTEHILCLSKPFPVHLRFPTHIVFIPVVRGGILTRVWPLSEALASHVVWYKIMMSEGTKIDDPVETGQWPFVACFVVIAKMHGQIGREMVRSIGEQVRREFRYSVG